MGVTKLIEDEFGAGEVEGIPRVAENFAFEKRFSHLKERGSLLIIDPRGRPTVTAGSDHCFHTCCPSVCPYVRPHFSNLAIQNKENNDHNLQDSGSGRVDHS